MLLNNNWKLKYFEPVEERDADIASVNTPDRFWMSVKVPGDVHSTLLEHKIIDNPFFGHNDQKCQWVEDKVWWYRKKFNYDKDLADDERLLLVFEGLDTFATVYLNGLKIGNTDNMFISHHFDVGRDLLDGENVLAVKFEPVSEHTVFDVDIWASYSKERVWARKAQMNFGWDWAPRLATVGIWKDVRLEKYRKAKIDSVFAKTVCIRKERAVVEVDLEIDNFEGIDQLEVEVSLIRNNEVFVERVEMNSAEKRLYVRVDHPELWWTNDLGPANLYRLRVRLLHKGEELDLYENDFGIRTIDVEKIDEEGNNVFTFVLNGVRLFARGADWIPVDSFIGAADDSRYRSLISLARDANMNMLRIWGGGIYEKDIFYKECNRQGILVWQDFMFACAEYPDYNRDFMRNVENEIVQVVKRLRNEPCLAIWCGNNENHWIYEKKFSMGEIDYPFYGEKIYDELMPELLKELDPTRLYWPGSPYGGNDHNDSTVGDTHNWQVWHGLVEPRRFGEEVIVDFSSEGVSFRNFGKDVSRFVSEFGIHALANHFTLENNIPEGEFYLGSDELLYRSKDIHHEKGIALMEGYSGIPEDVEEYMDFSMLTQAEGLRYGIEHYRRRSPETSGTLFWQFNDCWPGTSWSVVDYYLLPKASYYYARKFYHPVLLSLKHNPGEEIEVWVSNDRREIYEDKLQVEILDFQGNIIYSEDFDVSIEDGSSKKIAVYSEEEVLKDSSASSAVVRLISGNGITFDKMYYLRDNKDLAFPDANIDVEIDKNRGLVKIISDKQARFVKLEIPQEQVIFSDNFFDMAAAECRVVEVGHLNGDRVRLDNLKLKALNAGEIKYRFK